MLLTILGTHRLCISSTCTDIVAAAVLSGNRNFEGRVHPLTRANYLASPPLVVAYALAGTVCSLICALQNSFSMYFLKFAP